MRQIAVSSVHGLKGGIDNRGDEDYYRLVVPDGVSVALAILTDAFGKCGHDIQVSAGVQLQDSSGTEVGGGVPGSDCTYAHDLLAGGTYYLRVQRRNALTVADEYWLHVAVTPN